MLFGDLSAADAVALESAFFDESACKVSFGTLKDASCARKFERLLFFSCLHAVFTELLKLLGVPLLQGKTRGKNDISACLIDTFSVAVGVVGKGTGADMLAVKIGAFDENTGDLRLVCACVHIDRAADGGRNTVCKFESRKSATRRFSRDGGERCACLRFDEIFAPDNALQCGREDDKPAKARVVKEHIGGVADDERLDVFLFGKGDEGSKLLLRARKCGKVGASSDLEGGMLGKGKVLLDDGAEIFFDGLHRHTTPFYHSHIIITNFYEKR